MCTFPVYDLGGRPRRPVPVVVLVGTDALAVLGVPVSSATRAARKYKKGSGLFIEKET